MKTGTLGFQGPSEVPRLVRPRKPKRLHKMEQESLRKRTRTSLSNGQMSGCEERVRSTVGRTQCCKDDGRESVSKNEFPHSTKKLKNASKTDEGTSDRLT
jgi:hypothetical protein